MEEEQPQPSEPQNELSRSQRKKLERQHAKEERREERKKDAMKGNIQLTITILVILVVVGGGAYWLMTSALKKPVLEPGNHPSWGPEDASVVIYEFGDYQCPYTKKFQADV